MRKTLLKQFLRPMLLALLAMLSGQALVTAQPGGYNNNNNGSSADCPLVIANDQTYTLANCSNDYTFYYSFNLGGSDCDFDSEDFRTSNLYFNGVKASNNAQAFTAGLPGGIGVVYAGAQEAGEEGILVSFRLTDVDAAEAGTYTVRVAYDDDNDGSISDEPAVDVKIAILAQQPTTNYQSLSCTGAVNVRLDENCEANIKASMVLNGTLVCDEDFYVQLVQVVNGRSYTSPSNGYLPWGCGDYIYRVYRDYDHDNVLDANETSSIVCWGNVVAEDKEVPVVVAPANTELGANNLPAFYLSSELDGSESKFDPTVQGCFGTLSFLGYPTLASGNRYYDLHEFAVSKSGIYTFLLETEVSQGGLAAIYAGALKTGAQKFDADFPCENIIAFGDYTFGPALAGGQGDYLNLLANINGWRTLPFFNGQAFGGSATEPTIRLYLEAGQTYTLLTSTTVPLAKTEYAWYVFADDKSAAFADANPTMDGTQNPFAKITDKQLFVYSLVCNDLSFVTLPALASGQNCYTTTSEGDLISINSTLRNILERTGFPHADEDGSWYPGKGGHYAKVPNATDNCGDITVCVTEEINTTGDCAVTEITRTFTATDACGKLKDSDVQIITVRKPTLDDVVLPHYTAYVECDETFAIIPGTDHPAPSVTGTPVLATTYGNYDLLNRTSVCNLAAVYTDKARIDVCDNAFKFIREWTIYDWCNPGRTIIYNQLIKVGDFTAPTVGELPVDPWDCAPTFSTGPFTCQASFSIPMPNGISDNCSTAAPTIKVDILTFVPEKDAHGYLTGEYTETVIRSGLKPGQAVTGVPKGMHLFKYVVEDACHNKVTKYFWFQVIDSNEPIAQVDDALNVSISAQSTSSVGNTRIYAEDIDEGSYDDCEAIELRVRRSFANLACADQFATEFYGVAFSSLKKFEFSKVNLNTATTYNGEPLFYYAVANMMEPAFVYGTADKDGKLVQPVFTEENGVLYSLLNTYVDVLCCDVKTSVRIELWAFDDANMDQIPGNIAALYGTSELYTWLGENYAAISAALLEDARAEYVPAGLPVCGDIKDNMNIAWMDVTVEDKSKPVIKPPVNQTLVCTDPKISYQQNFSTNGTRGGGVADTTYLEQVFGKFEAVDNCGAQVVVVDVKDTRDNCGAGVITRRYQAVDSWGNKSAIATQTITVTKEFSYQIGFPADKEGDCGAVLDTCIFVREEACDLLAVSVQDTRYTASGDECYKIERVFKVINWCEYDGISNPTIIGRDEDKDGKPGNRDIWVIRKPATRLVDRDGRVTNVPARTYIDGTTPAVQDLCAANLNLPAFTLSANGTPSGVYRYADHNSGLGSATGFYQYTQFIKVYDDIDPTVQFDAQNFPSFSSDVAKGCPAKADIVFSVEENCTPNDLTIKVFLDAFSNGIIDANNLPAGSTGSNTLKSNFGATLIGTYPNYTIAGGTFPLGDHVFEVHVVDGCGNGTIAKIPFSIIDAKAPAPICINGLAIELMPVIPAADVDGDGVTDNGAMAVWASDFADADKISDCSGPVKLAIYRSDDPILAQPGFKPNPAHTSVTLTCSDVADNAANSTVLVRIYAMESPLSAKDSLNNFDFCETYVLVQNNNGACTQTGSGSIAGTIQTAENKLVEGVTVQISGQASKVTTTNLNGQFQFNNLLPGYDYTVTPVKDNNYLNGVSTFDLVLISKHILGVQPLNTPYKMIAADVNNSKSITALDLIHLRKLILSVDTEFANNTSWRFVDASFNFPSPTNPWASEFPEVTNINDLAGALSNVNFVAVKIGDVNGNATVALSSVEERDLKGTFRFNVSNTAMKAGNTYTVDFRASELAAIQGFQGTLTFDANSVELVDIVEGVAKEENFGLNFVEQGVITTSWDGEAADDAVVFSLVLRAKADVEVANVLNISSRYTAAEAYNAAGESMNVAIQFSNGAVAAAGFELMQNVPNPANGLTTITFTLPTAADVTLTVSDITGKVLKVVNKAAAKQDRIELNSNELPAGVLTYTLQSGDFTATKKMVVVK